MLLDCDEHRLHRRALSVAFKSGPMKSYLAELDTGILERVTRWRQTPGPMLVDPAMTQITLDLAATSLLGAGIGPEVDEITRAFGDMVAAAVTPIRQPWPGTQMARGVKGRKRVVAYFSEQIPIRRAKGGEDLFSQLCRATHEDGALLSTQDIVDHMSFLMMAAHDTLTSSLTSFVGALAAQPEWQVRLRDEVSSLGVAAGKPTTFDNLEAMPLTEMAFKEALRMKPPVPSMPRRATRDFSFRGYAIPTGTLVGVNPLFTHHMPEIWPEPEKFDPLRFTAEAQRGRHRFAWDPSGAAPHSRLRRVVDPLHQLRRLSRRLDRKAQRLAENAGGNHARRNRVDADADFAELHRHAFGEVNDGGLGRAIDHGGGIARQPSGNAAIVDNAAGTLAAHMGRGVLHAEHHP